MCEVGSGERRIQSSSLGAWVRSDRRSWNNGSFPPGPLCNLSLAKIRGDGRELNPGGKRQTGATRTRGGAGRRKPHGEKQGAFAADKGKDSCLGDVQQRHFLTSVGST